MGIQVCRLENESSNNTQAKKQRNETLFYTHMLQRYRKIQTGNCYNVILRIKNVSFYKNKDVFVFLIFNYKVKSEYHQENTMRF